MYAAPASNSARCSSGICNSIPASRSASLMLSTPANFSTTCPLWNQCSSSCNCAAAAVGRQARTVRVAPQTARENWCELGRNFAAPALRPQHASDGDEAGSYSTISN